MAEKQANEQRYYDALKRITKYMSPQQIYRDSHNVGLDESEYLEMSYENIQGEAKNAIRGKRRPK